MTFGSVKVLANKLRLVIGSVLFESHIAFVKDRQILDGILIVNEVADKARKSKKELMLFKIEECVCTATASVLVNGSPTDDFPFEWGLRQGYSIAERDLVSMSHLQFVDYTLLLESKVG
ncbi:cysteine-rich receptor-like protein kinase [Trifolium pratense]|uniref:Cysteine-rich receptor-like protein kinase n=1 Tax=Trifolium pratense TaxID=57577 RepID=A0A2K3MYY4_TRIPR|nr:cysteine-rich receptor-like protein kinase [Trifolium pratense]